MYIYKITNTINNKIYIGQTIGTIEKRFHQHKINSKTKNYPLYNAFKKYGIENFTITKICKCNNIEELNELEEFLIQEMGCLSPNGYNLASGGSNFKHNKETKQKMSNIAKNRSVETKKKTGKAGKGRKCSDKTRKKISDSLKGRKCSDEARKNMSDAKKKMTDETKQKLREINKGKKLSEEHKQKISNSMKGKNKKGEIQECIITKE